MVNSHLSNTSSLLSLWVLVLKAFEITDQDEKLDEVTKSKMVKSLEFVEKDLWIVLNETVTCYISGPLHGFPWS
jgi:hypothetical protein